jgi:hypothetical protein
MKLLEFLDRMLVCTTLVFCERVPFHFSVRIRKVVAKIDYWRVRFDFLTAVTTVTCCNAAYYRESSPPHVVQERRGVLPNSRRSTTLQGLLFLVSRYLAGVSPEDLLQKK